MPSSSTPAPEPPALRRGVLGTGAVVFLVVAAAAPLTVMSGVAPLALAVGGIGVPVGYLGAGAVLCLFAVAFTTMTRHVDADGAFYAYIARGLGRPLGLASALLALFAYSTLQIGVYGLLASQARASLLQFTGVDVPWVVPALLGVVVVTAVCWSGIEAGARLLGVLLAAETLVLVLMVAGVVVRGGAHGLGTSSFTPDAVLTPGMGAVLGVCFAAYMGFESTVIYRREARDPARTVPRATYVSVVGMAVFYCVVTWAVVEALGAGTAQGAAAADLSGLFSSVTTTYVGGWAAALMGVLVVTSALASQIAFHHAVVRYAHQLAVEGVLPRAFSRLHPRHGSPTVPGLVQSALAVVVVVAFAVAGADPYLGLMVWVNAPGAVAMLVLQLLAAVAAVVFMARRPHLAGRTAALVCGTAAAVLLAVATWVLTSGMQLMTGVDSPWNAAVVAMTPLVLVLGLGLAVHLRRTRPHVLEALGGAGPDPGAPSTTTADAAPAPAREHA